MTVIDKLRQLKLAEPIAIIGAGVTGKSCADLLATADIDYHVFDESDSVPDSFSSATETVTLTSFSAALFADYGTILLSPGVDTRRSCFAKNEQKLLTDIELFARLTEQPIIGVTGSNGKSTVVTLIAEVTRRAGKSYSLCGNIGLPVLGALLENDAQNDGYIVELSSYHLERSPSLDLAVGVWLNVSPDHLDRYSDYEAYVMTKAKIFACSKQLVVNVDDARVAHESEPYSMKISCSQQSEQTDFYTKGEWVYHRQEAIFSLADFPQMGRHHADNIMAVFAVAQAVGIDNQFVIDALRHFKPLPNRAVVVGQKKGITFINDSKGTNIGATVAAILGLVKPIILIAGGQGKGQDFNVLARAAKGRVKHFVLLGEDAEFIQQAVMSVASCTLVDDLESAVKTAYGLAESGDIVMLSPACASFDMFPSYIKRGELFETIVKELICE